MVHHPVDRRGTPPLPLTTGEAARLLGTTEPTLSEAVRRQHVTPPPIMAGRRLWSRDHLLEAAEHLGLLTEDLHTRLGGECHG